MDVLAKHPVLDLAHTPCLTDSSLLLLLSSPRLESLRSLVLRSTTITNDCLSALPSFAALRALDTLDLSRCTNFTEEALAAEVKTAVVALMFFLRLAHHSTSLSLSLSFCHSLHRSESSFLMAAFSWEM